MINLLADNRKNELKAARTNVIIARYIGLIVLAFAFIGGSLYVSYNVLAATMKNANNLVATNDVKADVYKGTKQQVDELSTKLTEAKGVLNQEVRYSELLVKLGQLMPPGTVLGNTTLTNANFSGAPTELKAYAKSTAEASTLQSRFQTSPLFSQVNLKGTETSGGIDGFPVTITMTVIFNRTSI